MKTYKVELTKDEISKMTFFLLMAKWTDYVEDRPELFKACNDLWYKFFMIDTEIIEGQLEVVD